MDITLVYLEGYDLNPEVIKETRKNCQATGSKFKITHDWLESYRGADIFYSRNWMSPRPIKMGYS
jgi:ornithine carbamoyltransferase